MRDLPDCLPRPRFTADDQQHAWDSLGANCGPGALAGMCAITPLQAAHLMGPEFLHRRATTEIMLERALDALDIAWTLDRGRFPVFGICRILWAGPWTGFYDRLRHAHWVGVSATPSGHYLFDINAIAVGGWISFTEWTTALRPWLLTTCEPLATGGWEIGEAYTIPSPFTGDCHDTVPEIHSR